MGADGKPAVFPWSGSAHREMLSELRMEEFDVRPGPAVAERVSVARGERTPTPETDGEPPAPGPEAVPGVQVRAAEGPVPSSLA
jgi:hypothetical protein